MCIRDSTHTHTQINFKGDSCVTGYLSILLAVSIASTSTKVMFVLIFTKCSCLAVCPDAVSYTHLEWTTGQYLYILWEYETFGIKYFEDQLILNLQPHTLHTRYYKYNN